MIKLTTIERIYLAILLIAFMLFSVFIPYLIAQNKISNVPGVGKSMIWGLLLFSAVIIIITLLITAIIDKIIVYLVTKQKISFGYTLFICLISAFIVQVLFVGVQLIDRGFVAGTTVLIIQSILRNAIFTGLLDRKVKVDKIKLGIVFAILLIIDVLVAVFLK